MQNKLKRAALVLVAIGGLSACQKSSPCGYSLTGNRTTDANSMAACLNDLSPTPVAMMPATGSATYNGFLSGNIASASIAGGDTIISDAVVTANFGAGTVGGSMSNITSTNQGSLGGTLSISGATIAGNLILGADVNGTLTGYGLESITFATTTSSLGSFAGENAQGIGIGTTGTVTFSGATLDGTSILSIIAFQ